jgi:hypothetical protein
MKSKRETTPRLTTRDLKPKNLVHWDGTRYGDNSKKSFKEATVIDLNGCRNCQKDVLIWWLEDGIRLSQWVAIESIRGIIS